MLGGFKDVELDVLLFSARALASRPDRVDRRVMDSCDDRNFRPYFGRSDTCGSGPREEFGDEGVSIVLASASENVKERILGMGFSAAGRESDDSTRILGAEGTSLGALGLSTGGVTARCEGVNMNFLKLRLLISLRTIMWARLLASDTSPPELLSSGLAD